jgi:hypothetical protein
VAKTLRQHAAKRVSELNYWARADNAPATLTVEELINLIRQARGNCQLCKKHVGWWNLQIDHIIAKGPNGGSSIDNLRMLCRECNRRKGDAPIEIAESPDYYTEKEVREMLGWGYQQMRTAIKSGKVIAIKYTMTTFIAKESVNALLREEK